MQRPGTLTNMQEAKTLSSPMAACDSEQGDRPRYPYGLEITLNSESLAKLKLELPDVGETVNIEAKATVTRVAQNAEGGTPERSLTLQITDLACDCEDEDATTPETALYASKRE